MALHKKVWLTLTLSIGLTIGQAEAVNAPRPQTSDQCIALVNYSPNNVVPIAGQTFVTTQIEFGHDEHIENVQNGDTAAWQASINRALPNMLFIKPTAFDSHTNMIVVTNKHTYYFALKSNQVSEKSNHQLTYAIKFRYPNALLQQQIKQFNDQQQAAQAMLNMDRQPNHYNWHYSFSGDRAIAPLHVFDDGQFTYFQCQPHQPVPAIFAVDNPNGHEAVVNYRQKGHYLIVERVAPQFTLRVGKDHVASIFNNTLIAKLKGKPFTLETHRMPSPAITASPVVPLAKPITSKPHPTAKAVSNAGGSIHA